MTRWCGNDPRARLTEGDRAVVDAFAAYLAWAKVRDEQGAEAAGPEPTWPDGTSVSGRRVQAGDE